MGFAFEKFEHAGCSFVPKVSVRNNGSIGVSQGALRRFGITENDRYVNLFYDRANKVIGIRPVPENTPGSVKLIQRSINGQGGKVSINAFISAKSFLDFYEIDYSTTRSFIAKKLESENLIIFDLKAPEDRPKQPNGGGVTTKTP